MNTKYTVYWSDNGRNYEYSYPVSEAQAKTIWAEKQKSGIKYGGFSAGDTTKQLDESNRKANKGPIKMALYALGGLVGLFLIYKAVKK